MFVGSAQIRREEISENSGALRGVALRGVAWRNSSQVTAVEGMNE